MPRTVRVDVGNNMSSDGQSWNAINSVDVTGDANTATAVDLGFSINFGGTSFSTLFINENGYVSFGTPITFDPTITNLSQLNGNVVAPYYADLTSVASTGELSSFSDGTVSSSTGEVDFEAPFASPATPAFRVTWFNVGVPNYANLTGTIQAVFYDTDGAGAGGNFDLEFNYDMFDPPPPITAGFVSSLNNVAYAGPFESDGLPGAEFFHFCNGAFSSTSCTVTPPTDVPEPASLDLFAAGLVLLGVVALRRRLRLSHSDR
jgi:hypothetical protein